MANDLAVRLVVVLVAVILVIVVARARPAFRPKPLSIAGNLDGPGVFLFTSETCDSCVAARAVYVDVLGEDGFVEHSWEAQASLLTRLGVEEIPVGTVLGADGTEIAAFRLIPRRRALARAVRKMGRV